ncbi:alpha-amylase family glycosyl hydrolase [Propionibacteriaceae bacterium G57]|uniref:alpha-amylase family glycosyl hydrolase n=1 Tax=Aestuariimicrobium sp. G57 TaxID=3418485 RepID=UPI003DA78F4E
MSLPVTRRSRLRDLLATPVGRDATDKVVLFSGVPAWVPRLVGGLRLDTLDRLVRPIVGEGLVDALIGLANAGLGSAAQDEPSAGEREPVTGPQPWWRSAVFAQVYPRSFADSNGDGIGDLRGIIDHLDHFTDLGVDALWLSPVFDSPNRDMGYDVRDYRAVMAEMGTLDDLDELIAGCHRRGLRIVLDLVVNHTSTEHRWYQKALADPDSAERGYYFFRDGNASQPPNNWNSFFSGPAWRWEPSANAWALHLFDQNQVDLNWDNPAVRREVADIVGWWLDRGVDGFRLDVINYISKQPGLPDGHPFVGRLFGFTGIEHYFHGPMLHEHLAALRRDGFTRPDGTTAVMIGETPGIGIETGRLLSGAGRGELDLVFNFDALETPGHTRWDDYRYNLGHLVDFWLDYNARVTDDWVALFLENHDNPRMVSKVAGQRAADPAVRVRVARLLATLLLTMRGTPFLFQGQELGAVNEPFRGIDDLRDVESLNRYAELVAGGMPAAKAWRQVLAGSRDHARTPIRWTEHQDDSSRWLRGHDRTPGFSVEAQRDDPRSVLAWYRALLALRRAHLALATGDIECVHRSRDLVAWLRSSPDETWLVEANLGGRVRRRPRLGVAAVEVLATTTGGDAARLAPWSAVISRLR